MLEFHCRIIFGVLRNRKNKMPPKATRQLAATETEATSGQLQVVADVHHSPREEAEGNYIYCYKPQNLSLKILVKIKRKWLDVECVCCRIYLSW